MKKLTETELKKMKNGELNHKRCPCCDYSGIKFIYEIRWYGGQKISMQCANCGHQVDVQGLCEHIETKTKFGTLLTFGSLTKKLFEAVAIWNKEALQKVNTN